MPGTHLPWEKPKSPLPIYMHSVVRHRREPMCTGARTPEQRQGKTETETRELETANATNAESRTIPPPKTKPHHARPNTEKTEKKKHRKATTKQNSNRDHDRRTTTCSKPMTGERASSRHRAGAGERTPSQRSEADAPRLRTATARSAKPPKLSEPQEPTPSPTAARITSRAVREQPGATSQSRPAAPSGEEA